MITDAQYTALVAETHRRHKCYAGTLVEFRHAKPGWPNKFTEPTEFAGRMAKAARLPDLTGTDRPDKPWLNGLPRLWFISDMGDALSSNIPFDFLYEEIVRNVLSPHGLRHVWLWLTKRPKRMAQFAAWLADRGVPWPANLVAMTSVTNQETAYRVNQLREVPATMRGLSVEPLWGEVTLDLTGIDWVIVGGESGPSAEPFAVDWALHLREQCRTAGVAFFLKQLGRRPSFNGEPIRLADPHGGDWEAWPQADWRVRELPDFARLVQPPVVG